MAKYIGAWAIFDEDCSEGFDTAFQRYKDAGIQTIMYGDVAFTFDVHREYYINTCIDPMIEIEHAKTYGDAWGTKHHLINSNFNNVRELASRYQIDLGFDITPGVSDPLIAKYPHLAVTDVEGKRSKHWMCPANPDVRQYFFGRVEDILDYNLGIKEVELDVVSLDFYDPQIVPDWVLPELYPLRQLATGNCFCEHCSALAISKGLDLVKVKKEISAIYQDAITLTYQQFKDLHDSYRGAFDILRFVIRHPLLVDWLRFRGDIVNSFILGMKKVIKSKNPNIIISNDLVSPSFSWTIGQIYADQPSMTDLTKLMIYHKRIGSFEYKPLEKIQKAIPQINDVEILDQYYRLKGFSGPNSLLGLKNEGIDVENIYYEVRKAKLEVGSSHKIIVGLVGDNPATPLDVESAVTMAHNAGADGYMLHLWYGNAPKENIIAFGEILHRLGEIRTTL